jgi:hypothetical protein
VVDSVAGISLAGTVVGASVAGAVVRVSVAVDVVLLPDVYALDSLVVDSEIGSVEEEVLVLEPL